jgi:hypothetical protein
MQRLHRRMQGHARAGRSGLLDRQGGLIPLPAREERLGGVGFERAREQESLSAVAVLGSEQ